MPLATEVKRSWDETAEVSRGHINLKFDKGRPEPAKVDENRNLDVKQEQKMSRPHAESKGRERNPREYESVRHTNTAETAPFHSGTRCFMEAMVERENMLTAWKRVKANKGAPGVDGMTVDALWPWLFDNWAGIKEELLNGEYRPQPVLKVEIPKPGGGMSMLGIPTVKDRLIQQALLQILPPICDGDFSENSFGFRAGRSAVQAVNRVGDRSLFERSSSHTTFLLPTSFYCFTHDVLL